MEKLKENIWKLNVDSNVYFLDIDEKVVIDCGPRQYREDVINELGENVDFGKVDRVVFTHIHYDHVGNFDLFPNARFFASKEEIEDFENNPLAATGLDPILLAKFKKIKLEPLEDFLGIKVIHTPGHSRGSVCLLYDKVLFSGDTKFNDGMGRIDLPTSDPSSMKDSLDKISKIDYDILAPGHDY